MKMKIRSLIYNTNVTYGFVNPDYGAEGDKQLGNETDLLTLQIKIKTYHLWKVKKMKTTFRGVLEI